MIDLVKIRNYAKKVFEQSIKLNFRDRGIVHAGVVLTLTDDIEDMAQEIERLRRLEDERNA